MSFEREVRLLVKPLLGADPDLHYFGKVFFIGPVRHFLLAFWFKGYRIDDHINLYPDLTLLPTASPTNAGNVLSIFTQYNYVRRWNLPLVWRTDDPGYPEIYQTLLRERMIPPLKKIRTLEAFRREFDAYHLQDLHLWGRGEVMMSVMFGEFDRAGKEADNDRRYRELFNVRKEGVGDRLAEQGDALSTADKRALIALLHQRERSAAVAMKLDKRHWEPSLFPVEERHPELRVLAPDGTIAEE